MRQRNQISRAFFWTDEAREIRRAEAGVEAPHPRPGLSEDGVVGGDRQIADEVQHVAAADRVARDHGDDRLRQAPNHALEVEHVEARHAVVADVALRAAHALIAAAAKRLVAGAGQDDDADRGIFPRRG